MKQTARNTLIGTLVLLFGGCDKETVPLPEQGEGVPIAFHTHVVSEERPSAGESARLLFWGDDDFHDKWIRNTEGVRPHYTVLLDKEINHYTYESKIYYQTPYTYPYNYEKIHATGYAPDYALSAAQTGDRKDYRKLTVKEEYQDGSVDFLTCDGCIAHSASMNPDNTFLKEGGEKELWFRHLTAKLTFYGKRDPEMYGLVGVRKVKIKVHNSGADGRLMVPAALDLYAYDAPDDGTKPEARQADYSTYTVSQMKPYPDDQPQFYYQPIIPAYDTSELGRCYVLSEGIRYGTEEGQFDPIKGEWQGIFQSGLHPKLTIDIKAELYNAEPGSGLESFIPVEWKNVEVKSWSDVDTGNMLLPGYEYNVTILFNRLGIALRAEAVPWNSEELHEYPVHPQKPVTK